jgi:hypothetical protein
MFVNIKKRHGSAGTLSSYIYSRERRGIDLHHEYEHKSKEYELSFAADLARYSQSLSRPPANGT